MPYTVGAVAIQTGRDFLIVGSITNRVFNAPVIRLPRPPKHGVVPAHKTEDGQSAVDATVEVAEFHVIQIPEGEYGWGSHMLVAENLEDARLLPGFRTRSDLGDAIAVTSERGDAQLEREIEKEQERHTTTAQVLELLLQHSADRDAPVDETSYAWAVSRWGLEHELVQKLGDARERSFVTHKAGKPGARRKVDLD